MMKRTFLLWPFFIVLSCASNVHAQLYKWVGPDGKITYSDTPPPSSARSETKPGVGGARGSGAATDPNLPYELAEAMKNHPVVLYTTANCMACDEGRKLLKQRGIPFSEKTVTSSEDIAQLRQAGGSSQLPFLTVGRSKQQGFEESIWNGLLSGAGYPEANKLPKTYRYSSPEAAAPLPQPTGNASPDLAGTSNAPQSRSEEPPPATGNAPPGFRF